MPNATGKRAVWSVLVPCPNTSAEVDAWTVRPADIAFHFCPMPFDTDSALDLPIEERVAKYLRGEPVELAAISAVAANPDHVIMWCTSNTFLGGPESSKAFKEEFRRLVGGRSVTMGSEAAAEALTALEAKRIAILTPYPRELEPDIREYFGSSGIDIVAIRSLGHNSADDIVNIPQAHLVQELQSLAQTDVDTILQLGAAMPMLRLGAEAEHWLQKNVVSLSTAVIWSALRSNGFADQFSEFGALLRDH